MMRMSKDMVRAILRLRIECRWGKGRCKLNKVQVMKTEMAVGRINGTLARDRWAKKAEIYQPPPPVTIGMCMG